LLQLELVLLFSHLLILHIDRVFRFITLPSVERVRSKLYSMFDYVSSKGQIQVKTLLFYTCLPVVCTWQPLLALNHASSTIPEKHFPSIRPKQRKHLRLFGLLFAMHAAAWSGSTNTKSKHAMPSVK
jgi:hypothetical protein